MFIDEHFVGVKAEHLQSIYLRDTGFLLHREISLGIATNELLLVPIAKGFVPKIGTMCRFF